jgi:hypothetical protein
MFDSDKGATRMSNNKRVVWYNVFSASIFLLSSLAIYTAFFHVFPQPFFNDAPLEIRAKIENAQEIESLRRIALQQDDAQREGNKDSNKMLSTGVELLITLGLSAACFFVINILLWMRIMREQRKESIPWWLRWI